MLAACDAAYGPEVQDASVANQEYARAWARLALSAAADRPAQRAQALRDLAHLGWAFLVSGRAPCAAARARGALATSRRAAPARPLRTAEGRSR